PIALEGTSFILQNLAAPGLRGAGQLSLKLIGKRTSEVIQRAVSIKRSLRYAFFTDKIQSRFIPIDRSKVYTGNSSSRAAGAADNFSGCRFIIYGISTFAKVFIVLGAVLAIAFDSANSPFYGIR